MKILLMPIRIKGPTKSGLMFHPMDHHVPRVKDRSKEAKRHSHVRPHLAALSYFAPPSYNYYPTSAPRTVRSTCACSKTQNRFTFH